MERNRTDENRGARRGAERDAAKPIDGEHPAVDKDDELQEPESVPSFLTARELQAHDPAKGQASENPGGDRHGAASSSGAKGEPRITDDEPPRGGRGLPDDRSERMRKRPG
jgi:hypothetical protein